MRLMMWEASHTSEKKEGWRYTHVSPEVNKITSTLGHLLDQQNCVPECIENFPFMQCISLCFTGSSTMRRYLVEKYFFSFPLWQEICRWTCAHYDSARVCMRFLSLPGAWQQWPPNGMGPLAPTSLPQHGHLVRTVLHLSASSSMNVSKFLCGFCP